MYKNLYMNKYVNINYSWEFLANIYYMLSNVYGNYIFLNSFATIPTNSYLFFYNFFLFFLQLDTLQQSLNTYIIHLITESKIFDFSNPL
jgi:hypothetical protein